MLNPVPLSDRMRPLLFTMIANCLYLLFLVISSPYYLYSVCRRDKHRAGLGQKFGWAPAGLKSKTAKRVWIHAVSVGEVLLCKRFIAAIQAKHPDWEVVLSMTTATGSRVAADHYPDLQRFFFPFDLSWVVRKRIAEVAPDMILLVELELWPNFIREAKRQQIPTYVINGRLSERSLRGFKRVQGLLQPMFDGVTAYLMQNENYCDHVRQLGVKTAKVYNAHNLKIDALNFEAQNDKVQSLLSLISSANPGANAPAVLVSGSTHEPEEQYLIDAIKPWLEAKRLLWICVPRHPERYDHVTQVIEKAGLSLVRKSALDQGEASEGAQVVLLDTMGELAQVYGLATAVFIGGSLNGHGGQNLMEPFALGKPVLCGPDMHNFKEAVALLNSHQALTMIDSADQLKDALEALLYTSEGSDKGLRGQAAMQGAQGATNIHLDLLDSAFNSTAKEPAS